MPYEELIKQCPFLSQRASLSLENKSDDNKLPEIQISKSKKKRLKRRLKAISLNSKLTASEELHSSFKADQSEMASKSKGVSVTDSRTNQEIEQPKRVNDEVDGEISFTHPKISAAGFLPAKDNKKKGKQQKKEGNKDDNIIIKQEKSAGPVIQKQSSIGNTSHQKVANKNLEVSNSQEKISSIKRSEVDNVHGKPIIAQSKIEHSKKTSREEIITEREAKKKAKQLAKQKKIDNDQGILPKIQPLESEINKNFVPECKLETNKDKSREDVLTEREAKKKAKQLAKQSKFEKSQEKTSEKNILGTESNKTEISLPVYDRQSEHKENVENNLTKNEGKVGETKLEGEKSKAQLKAERRAKQVFTKKKLE